MSNGTTTQPEQTQYTIEWAPFTLVEGVSEEMLLAASEALQREFIGRQPGFVRRELARGPANQWVDIVYWASREAAEAAGHIAMSNDVCNRYFSLMANNGEPGGGVSHLEQIQTYT